VVVAGGIGAGFPENEGEGCQYSAAFVVTCGDTARRVAAAARRTIHRVVHHVSDVYHYVAKHVVHYYPRST
jgi:hypothetical protein